MIMLKNLLFPAMLFLLSTNSCVTKHESFYVRQKRFHLISDAYIKKDSVIFQNYFLFTQARDSNYGESEFVENNSDSLVNILNESMKKLPEIYLSISKDLKNQFSESFYNIKYMDIRRFPLDSIINLGRANENVVSMVPIISIHHILSTNSSLQGWSDPEFLCFLSIAVFMIKNGKIIYYKQMFHQEKIEASKHSYPFYWYNLPIPQETWNSLVLEVMHDYIERLK
jgi:hypothetical protein